MALLIGFDLTSGARPPIGDTTTSTQAEVSIPGQPTEAEPVLKADPEQYKQ